MEKVLVMLQDMQKEQQEFRSEMTRFKEDTLKFQEDMTGFKEDTLKFQGDMTGFKEVALKFHGEMSEFRKEVKERFLNLEKLIIQNTEKLDNHRDHVSRKTKFIEYKHLELEQKVYELENRFE